MRHQRQIFRFTLVELLTVVFTVALAALLMGMALPGADAGGMARCADNLRRMGVAMQQYAIDHDGHITKNASGPPGGEAGMYFTNQLASYLGLPVVDAMGHFAPTTFCEIYRCPASHDDYLAAHPAVAGRGGVNYANNPELFLDLDGAGWGMKLAAVRKPSEKFYLYEGQPGGAYGSFQRQHYNHTPGGGASPIPSAGDWKRPASPPRNLAINVCWLDGHVSVMRQIIGCNYQETDSPMWRHWMPYED